MKSVIKKKLSILVFALIIAIGLSCSDSSVGDDGDSSSTTSKFKHEFLFSVVDSVEYITTEFVKLSWEDTDKLYLVEINDTTNDSAGIKKVDWYFYTTNNFLEFPSNLDPNDIYKFNESGVYTINVWSFYESSETDVFNTTFVSASLNGSYETVLAIVGDSTQSKEIPSFISDSTQHTVLDTLYDTVGVSISETDTTDIIHKYYIIVDGADGIVLDTFARLNDTLSRYTVPESSPNLFSFKPYLIPSLKIDSVVYGIGGDAVVHIDKNSITIPEDTLLDISYILQIEDMLNDTLLTDTIEIDTAYQYSIDFLNINSAYRFSVIAKTYAGFGKKDSIYPYYENGLDTVMLPYLYVSTFEKSVIVDTSFYSVQGGSFLMGDIWNADYTTMSEGAKPVHEVTLSSFNLNKDEVSVSQYIEFLDNMKTETNVNVEFNDSILCLNGFKAIYANTQYNPILINLDTSDSVISFTPKDSISAGSPMLSLTWEGAVLYCNWLSKMDLITDSSYILNESIIGIDTITFWSFNSDADGYRLPTEAEWEYVASGAFNGFKARYVVDDIFSNMSGSAYEWVSDKSDNLYGTFKEYSSYYQLCYNSSVTLNPYNGDPDAYSYVARGGSLISNDYEKQTFYRNLLPLASRGDMGFRVAKN